jgi:CHAT domain-containing protein
LHGAPLIPNGASGQPNALEVVLQSSASRADLPRRIALNGIVEARRAEAVALERLNRLDESADAAASAVRIAEANGLNQPNMDARLLRTSAFIEEARGHGGTALARLQSSASDFALSMPDSPAYTRTTLLVAKRQADAGNRQAALVTCRAAIAALRTAKLGADPSLLLPCLDLMNEAAGHAEGSAQADLRAEMFEAAELAQGSETSQEIAEASARLAVNARDPRIAALMKDRADLNNRLVALNAQLQEPEAGHAGQPASAADPALNAAILATRAALADKTSALQAAAPNFDGLVQGVASARDVMAHMRPGEAFCSIVLGRDSGWSFLLRDGTVSAAPVQGGAKRMAALVARVRQSLDSLTTPPPPFDTAAAAELYTAVLGGFDDQLRTATALIVAPSGPLLSVPFAILLTGPAQPDALGSAPWLLRRMVISHVPAPANFVSLRKLAGTSRATRPWFGFGDFRPVTQAQAAASFPPASCGDAARLLAGLPALPGAIRELDTVRRISGAGPSDELLGTDFTADAVLHASLKDTKILHFATHAILASDLKCQTEPALVTSAPASAPDAGAALLTASQVTQLNLDADTVILSACNTGGGSGLIAAESLSGLARSFFYAGARSLLVTHWDVNDQAAAYLVAKTILTARHDPSIGMAGALAAAQRSMITDPRGDLVHPFYWAPLALIGDGQGTVERTAMR